MLSEVEPRTQLRIGLEFFQTVLFSEGRTETSTKTSSKSVFFPAGKGKNCPSWSPTTMRAVYRAVRRLYFSTVFPLEIADSQIAQVTRLTVIEVYY